MHSLAGEDRCDLEVSIPQQLGIDFRSFDLWPWPKNIAADASMRAISADMLADVEKMGLPLRGCRLAGRGTAGPGSKAVPAATRAKQEVDAPRERRVLPT
jgi:hypothetical protein